MPVNVTDVSTFTDPIVIPADSDPADRTYIITLAQGLANRTRYLKDERDAIQGIVRPDLAASRGMYMHAIQGTPGWDSVDPTPRPGWNQGILGASSQGTGKAPFTFAAMPGSNLPQDCEINAVRVFLKGGVARPTSTDRMRVRVYGLQASMATALLGDERCDGGTTLNIVEVSGLAVHVNNDLSTVYGLPYLGLLVQIDPGVTAGVDAIYLAEIRYSINIR